MNSLPTDCTSWHFFFSLQWWIFNTLGMNAEILVKFKLDEIQHEFKQLSLHVLQCDADSWLWDRVKDSTLETVSIVANHGMLYTVFLNFSSRWLSTIFSLTLDKNLSILLDVCERFFVTEIFKASDTSRGPKLSVTGCSAVEISALLDLYSYS